MVHAQLVLLIPSKQQDLPVMLQLLQLVALLKLVQLLV
jgi:hypothetical protein